MSRSLNKVILIGNLGADPEVRSTSNGSRVATLSVATSRQWKNQSGEKQEKTEWHRVVLWNNKGSTLADIAEKYCKKGDKVYIEGSIEYRSWQDREGQTRYTTEITARELIMLSGRSDGSESSYSRAEQGGGRRGRGGAQGQGIVRGLPRGTGRRGRRPARSERRRSAMRWCGCRRDLGGLAGFSFPRISPDPPPFARAGPASLPWRSCNAKAYDVMT